MKKIILLVFISWFSNNLSGQYRSQIIDFQHEATWTTTDLNNMIAAALPAPFDNPVLVDALVQPVYDIDIYKAIYWTIDENGTFVKASGSIIAPQIPNTNCDLPVTLYAHGTVFDRDMVPSNQSGAGGIEFFFGPFFASTGYLTVMPDYIGLGVGNGLHKFVNAEEEAHASVDLMLFAKRKWQSDNPYLYVTGYSQGGHAAAAAAREIFNDHTNSANPLKVIALAPGAGPYAISSFQYDFLFDPNKPYGEYVLYTIQSAILSNPNTFGGSNFLSPWYNFLYNFHFGNQTGNVNWVPDNWQNMFLPGLLNTVNSNSNHPLRQYLKQQDVFDWNNPWKTKIIYHPNDQLVDPLSSIKFHNASSGNSILCDLTNNPLSALFETGQPDDDFHATQAPVAMLEARTFFFQNPTDYTLNCGIQTAFRKHASDYSLLEIERILSEQDFRLSEFSGDEIDFEELLQDEFYVLEVDLTKKVERSLYSFSDENTFITAAKNIVNKNADFEVYPNPATDAIFVKSSHAVNKITITTLTGQTVSAQIIGDNQNRIAVSDLSPGMYIIHSYDNNGIKVGSSNFIKE